MACQCNYNNGYQMKITKKAEFSENYNEYEIKIYDFFLKQHQKNPTLC